MTEIFENQTENAPAKVERQKVDMFLMGNQKYFPSSVTNSAIKAYS
jgi:hypothetical protein